MAKKVITKTEDSKKKVGTTGKGPDWYRHDVAWLKDVTAEESNEKLGLNRVYVFPPSTDAQVEAGIVAKVGIKLEHAYLKGTIFSNADAGTLKFAIDGSQKYEKDGEDHYWSPFDISPVLKAQTLRYVEAWMDEEEE